MTLGRTSEKASDRTMTSTSSSHLKDLSQIVSLAKQRGFVFQNSEIYGGLNSCWDYGPLGALMKLNLKNFWWKWMLRGEEDIVGLDSAIFMAPQAWQASGHVDNFTDPLVDCHSCRARFRGDEPSYEKKKQCPQCGSKSLTEPRQFNLMFKTHMGPLEKASSLVYLRPETAQGIFVNFLQVLKSMRKKIPFGIAQIGKAFRNEITPGHFLFRMREFEQMEMQYFVSPGKDAEAFEVWCERRWQFYKDLGFEESHLRFHPHGKDELAHYARAAQDIQYHFPMGWQELEGVHNRGDFDLHQHQNFSHKSLEYFDNAQNQSYLPFVIESSVGCDRLFLALLCDAYREDPLEEGGTRTRLQLKPEIAPIKAAFLPLSKKAPLQDMARQLYKEVTPLWDMDYDANGSIGKRYRRQDEIGTPFCVTVDFDSLKDHAVTLRHRDTMKQERVATAQLKTCLEEKLRDF